jgi:hypothetical protein
MIHEFAVEPEVMATWNHFRVLWDDFGVSRGRLLVEFPKEWRKRVHELAEHLSAPVKSHAIRSKLSDPAQRLHRLVGPGGRSFPHPSDWQRSALENQAGGRPFRAIVATHNPSNRPDVLVAEELERDVEPWRVNTQDDACPRRAHDMLLRVETLLRCSGELILVDPHFDPLEPRFARPFEAFVGVRPAWRRLELHSTRREPFTRELQEHHYRGALELAVPAGTDLSLVLWPGLPCAKRMHPRFVLTERGGVQFDYGLDEGRGSGDTTHVILLEHDVFLQRKDEYGPASRIFGEPEIITIKGRG